MVPIQPPKGNGGPPREVPFKVFKIFLTPKFKEDKIKVNKYINKQIIKITESFCKPVPRLQFRHIEGRATMSLFLGNMQSS